SAASGSALIRSMYRRSAMIPFLPHSWAGSIERSAPHAQPRDRFGFALERVPNTPHMTPTASPEAGSNAPAHTPPDRALWPRSARKRLARRARAPPHRVVLGRGDLLPVT